MFIIYNESIFQKIKELCDKNSISITALCVTITGSKGNLSTWKKGNIRSDYLSKIAEYFGVSVDDLLGIKKHPDESQSMDDEMAEILQAAREDPNLRVLFKLSSKAKPDEVKKYLNIIKTIRGEQDE